MISAIACGLILAVLLFVDLVTKALAHAAEVSQGKFFLGVVKLEFTRNSGIAWSGFANNPLAMKIITVLTIVMIIAIPVAFFTYFKKNIPARVALAAIEAGAIGNLIDRLYFGYVRDFISVKLLLPAYTCNVADMYIVLGAIALAFIILFIGKDAAFPLSKKWREESGKEEKAKEEAEKTAKEENE